MPDETAEKPAPPVLTPRQQAIKAWHDAKNLDEQKAAVKQFPVLAEIYSEAQNYL